MNIQNFSDFYSKYLQLIDYLPKFPLHNLRCENCEWGDYNFSCKNVIYGFDNASCQDSVYINAAYLASNCLDCEYPVETEIAYECIDPFKSYNTHFCNYCARLRDSYYCFDCNDSHDLFGCVYLNNKSFCIFNHQYEEEEYRQKVEKLLKHPVQEILKKVDKLIDYFPATQTKVTRSENSNYGNHVHRSKNMYLCFDAVNSRDCGYMYDSHHNTDCWDFTWTVRGELCYQCIGSADLYDCAFVDYSGKCRNSWFLKNCFNVKNSLGCVNLDSKEYCILNRQFSPEEYKKIVEKLKAELKLKAHQIVRW